MAKSHNKTEPGTHDLLKTPTGIKGYQESGAEKLNSLERIACYGLLLQMPGGGQ